MDGRRPTSGGLQNPAYRSTRPSYPCSWWCSWLLTCVSYVIAGRRWSAFDGPATAQTAQRRPGEDRMSRGGDLPLVRSRRHSPARAALLVQTEWWPAVVREVVEVYATVATAVATAARPSPCVGLLASVHDARSTLDTSARHGAAGLGMARQPNPLRSRPSLPDPNDPRGTRLLPQPVGAAFA